MNQRARSISSLPTPRRAWRVTPIAAAVAGVLWGSGDALAQQAGEGTQTVVITGIRRAIETSIAVKRDADGVVEAITAEDLGKLPDVSIAESLARLPGLAGQRVNGSTQGIQIRGMPSAFGVTLLNGREMVSGGADRSVEFDQFPSELMGGATVYKTPNASLGTQGLSGTVNLQSVRPLAFDGRQIVFNARVEKNSNGEQIPGLSSKGNRISASYIDQFANKTVGLALGFAHLDSPEQQQHYENWWWTNMAKYPGDWCGGAAADPACATPGVAHDAVALQGFEATAFSTNQVRDGLMAVIEYRPNKDLRTTVDLYYSKFTKKYVGREFQEDGFNTWSGTTIRNAVYDNWDGEKVLVGGAADHINGKILSRRNHRDDTIGAFGINNELKLGGWTTIADLSYSKADRDESTAEMYAGPGGTVSNFTSFTIRRDGVSQFVPSLNWSDPNVMQLQQFWGQMGAARIFKVVDEMKSLRLAGKRDLDWGFVSQIETGVNVGQRSKEYSQQKTAYDLRAGGTSAPIPAGVLMAPATLGFGAIPAVVNFDVQALLDTGLFSARADDLSSQPGRVWGVEETVTTAFAKFDLDFKVGGVPVRGNAGLQFVHSEQSATGLRWDDVAKTASPISGSHSYNDVLPSLNLTGELTSNTLLRLGLARTLARPNMEDMRAGIGGVGRATSGAGLWSASGGNPQLEPWRATSVDLSLEKYVDKRTYFAVAAFYKDLKSTIYKQNVPYDFTGFPDPCTPTPAQPCPAIITYTGTVNAPANGDGGWVRGTEWSFALDAGRFAGALTGFGLTGSASFTKSNIHQNNDLNNPLEGLSPRVTSLVVYYENAGFQTRIGQRTRSRNLARVRNIWGDTSFTTIEPERILDFQIGYGFDSGALKGFSVLFQVNNLNNEPYRTLSSVSDGTGAVPGVMYPTKYDRYGRQYLLGVTYKL